MWENKLCLKKRSNLLLLYLVAAISNDSFDLSISETKHFKTVSMLMLSFEVHLWEDLIYSPFLAILVVSVEFVLSSSSVSHWCKLGILSCFKKWIQVELAFV